MVSRSYRENQHLGRPQVKREWLSGNTEGLIALSAGRHVDVWHALLVGNQAEAERQLGL